MVCPHFAVLGVLACVGNALAVDVTDMKSGERDQMDVDLNSVTSSEVASDMLALSDALLDPDSAEHTNIPQAISAISSKMDLKSASALVSHKRIPADVSSLVQMAADSEANFAAKFDEASLEKARIALNELVEKAWVELDEKIFECKGFQDMNRNNYGQVARDLMRLLEQINDLERIEAEAIEGINQKDQAFQDLRGSLEEETKLYNIEYGENKAELTIRQNDLDVFQFILVFTKCPDATSLTQLKARVCETTSGRKTLLFEDSLIASKYQKLLTDRGKKNIDAILRTIVADRSNLVQQPGGGTTVPPPVKKAPVVGENGKPCVGSTGGAGGIGAEDECMKSCGPDPPDCALLHDKLSLMWGDYKDKVDELTMIMMKNEMEFEELKESFNAQMRMVSVAKARFQQLLAEARSNLAADRSELKAKNSQKRKLDQQYYRYMRACKKRIQWIMYQDMCAIKVVRNAVLENSTTCPSATILDCDLDSWNKHQCSVSCDDDCNPNLPFKCGGWAKMSRSVVVKPDKCGIKCPVLEKYVRCGQFKCPMDCHMSTWSGWSKCTADCEGGLQSHTRSIMTKPKNGGEQCNTVEESRPCNTQSCDRNCRLQRRWGKWTPCSVACGGGFQERSKHVLIPTRGEGRCPKPKSRFRYTNKKCNSHKCVGDEICIAKQDLVIALDGSGSVRSDGFDILKEYTVALLERYQMEYFGDDAMKIGIVLFGNGVIMPDGKTVSPAINAQKLTSSKADLETAVKGLPFKKGFTNMAQAFAMAEDMFIKGSRRNAQQAVMLVTDGRPSFAFMTNEMVEQLDDKGIMRFFLVVNGQGPNSDTMKQMRAWASQPWQTNMVHVQGLALLESDTDLWVEKALTKFCPMAYSPSTADYEAKVYGYRHIKTAGYCGGRPTKLGKVGDAGACAALAGAAGAQSFVMGKFHLRGMCFKGKMAVDGEQWQKWEGEKAAPSCPTGWKSSMMLNFFAIEPVKDA